MPERTAAPIAAVVLAAGGSRRLGRPKQLEVVGGEALLARAARVALACRAAHVAVVLGAHADALERALAGARVTLLRNEAWAEGMATSVHAAVRFAAALPACAGLLLLVCDQPLLTPAHLDRLIDAFEEDARTVGSAYGGATGVPAIFERGRWPALAGLAGDRGARALLVDARAIPWPEGALDCDTEDDVENARRRADAPPESAHRSRA